MPNNKPAEVLSSQFKGSTQYWEERYKSGRNSGAGSYGRLADYKATFLNSLVKELDIKSLAELGVGDGNQLSLSDYPKYTGYDVTQSSISACRQTFKDDRSKEFVKIDPLQNLKSARKVDATLSLDVIYHLIEDEVFEAHIYNLFKLSEKYVVIYSSNYNERSEAKHVRHRKFTDFVGTSIKGWELMTSEENPFGFDQENPDNTSHANFYVYKKL